MIHASFLALALALTSVPSTTATQRYTLPHLVTTYREGPDQVVVDIAYAIPRAGIAASGGSRDRVQIEQTITVTDSLGENYHQSWARPTTLPQAGSARIRTNYVIAREQLTLPGDIFDLHVGIRDLRLGTTGSFHETCHPPGQDSAFDISDLLLATSIEAPEKSGLSRSDLVIEPNPLRLYVSGESVFVFLELYGLRRDTFGQTNFEIAYRMERPTEDELSPELFEAIDRTNSEDEVDGQTYLVPSKHRSGVRVEKTWEGREGMTTIATRYLGDTTTDLTFLEFDISQLPEGIHKLTITATDLRVGSSVEKSVQFRVVGE